MASVLSSGLAVEGMLASGVAEYVEFKPLEALLWLEDDQDTQTKGSRGQLLSRVPCSKGDVFGTKMLAPMDKRRLMKFIQLSSEYESCLSL